MRKPITYFLLGVVSAFALIFTLWGLGNSTLFNIAGNGGGETRNITETVASPDGEYVATTHTAMGGGAAGWCYQRVSINKKDDPFSWEKEREKGGYSFNISCQSTIKLKWETNRDLQITYTGTADEAGLSIYQRPISEDRQVKIKYVPKP